MKNYQSISVPVEDGPEHDACNSGIGNGGIINPHPQDHLAPPFGSDVRPSTLLVGTFNLIATIVGGGVLSLPIVFKKCGILFTSLAMALSAGMTYMSLVMLCYCSRRSGGSSYGEVVRSAFGERMEEGVSWLLFVFLLFVITGYMILIRDIWTPLVRQILGVHITSDFVLLAIVGLLLPFLFQRSLHALRFNCYVGFCSILILCLALCRGGWRRLNEPDNGDNTETDESGGSDDAIEIFKMPSAEDILFCFPIVTCAFLCHFNIIAIQNALQKPTRERMQNLTWYAIGACFVLMWMLGLGGYLFAGSHTEGDILLNVTRLEGGDPLGSFLFLLGRIGCGTTIMLAMPLMLLPCRESLLEVVDVLFHRSHHNESNRPTAESEEWCWKLCHRYNKSETVQDAAITTEDELTEIVREASLETTSPLVGRRPSVLIRQEPIQRDYVFRNSLSHYGSTLLITTSCYFGAVAVSGVAVVWSLIGSSMAFFIAFILPCGCFIVTESAVPTVAEGGDRKGKWIVVAWAMLAFSIVGTVVCTINNTIGFRHR